MATRRDQGRQHAEHVQSAMVAVEAGDKATVERLMAEHKFSIADLRRVIDHSSKLTGRIRREALTNRTRWDAVRAILLEAVVQNLYDEKEAKAVSAFMLSRTHIKPSGSDAFLRDLMTLLFKHTPEDVKNPKKAQ